MAIGNYTMQYLTMGVGANGSNTAVGHMAMRGSSGNSDTAQFNTAVGRDSLAAITGGSSNVAMGVYSGRYITTGHSNVLLGQEAGEAMTTGDECILIGRQAGHLLNHDTDVDGSVMIGYQAGKDLTSAVGTFIGYLAGAEADDATTKAVYNTYVGYESGRFLDDGTHNTALGHQAMRSADADGQNANNSVAIGYVSLTNITDGDNNTAVGSSAGNLLTTGANNVIIGYDADVDANDRDGCIVIGSGLSLNTASDNVVEIGNNTNSMTYDLDGGDITVTSDVRTKKNIKDTKLGLEFINKLRPITYETKPSSEYPKEFGVKEPSEKSSGKTWDGLIAQEVKEVIDEMDVEFSGWEEGVNTKQRLAYGKFVMPLIKAVQELSARIKELEGK